MLDIEIVHLTYIKEKDSFALSRLISQLEGTNIIIPRAQLEKAIKSDNNFVFVAKCNDDIVGAFTLVIYHLITCLKASVEDMVVDSSMRGKGVGLYLLRFAIDYAKSIGVTTLDLTSKPSRVAANALYKKVGFQLRDTNVYRIEL